MEGQYLSGGYWRVTINGKVYGVHRLLWEEANGPVPDGFVVDHIDRNPLNNDLSNLRAIPRGANVANTTGSRKLPKGVYSRFAKRKAAKCITEIFAWVAVRRPRHLLRIYKK